MGSGIRAVFFDLDGTLVRYQGVDFESSWGALGVAAGLREEWDRLLSKYLGKPDRYPDWVRENAALLRGRSAKELARKLLPPPYAPGVQEAIPLLKAQGLTLGIISSGVDLVAGWVGKDLGLDFWVANELVVEGDRFTGEAVLRVGLWDKLPVVKRVAAERGLSLDQVAFVGDHVNDIPVLKAVGLGIAYAPKEAAVGQAARAVLRHFRELPALLNIG